MQKTSLFYRRPVQKILISLVYIWYETLMFKAGSFWNGILELVSIGRQTKKREKQIPPSSYQTNIYLKTAPGYIAPGSLCALSVWHCHSVCNCGLFFFSTTLNTLTHYLLTADNEGITTENNFSVIKSWVVDTIR